jgi:hypothetical protein
MSVIGDLPSAAVPRRRQAQIGNRDAVPVRTQNLGGRIIEPAGAADV